MKTIKQIRRLEKLEEAIAPKFQVFIEWADGTRTPEGEPRENDVIIKYRIIERAEDSTQGVK